MIDAQIPIMKKYPEIAVQNIPRFGSYFSSPSSNHVAALQCLVKVADAVPLVRPKIAEALGQILYEYLPVWAGMPGVPGSDQGSFEYQLVQMLLKMINIPITRHARHFKEIARSIVTLKEKMILIIGAGFSYDSMPITAELNPMLTAFLHVKGEISPAKLISEDIQKVWKMAKEDSALFRAMFAARCSEIKPARQHQIVSQMLHDGYISHIISLNWDDQIEKAYHGLYGMAIDKINGDGVNPSAPSLWKLHGDVEEPLKEWIFPYENGRVFESLMESLNASMTKETTKYLLIVGYGESEKEIADKLIKPLGEKIVSVLRIKPNWAGSDEAGIPESANIFFQRLDIYAQMEKRTQ